MFKKVWRRIVYNFNKSNLNLPWLSRKENKLRLPRLQTDLSYPVYSLQGLVDVIKVSDFLFGISYLFSFFPFIS